MADTEEPIGANLQTLHTPVVAVRADVRTDRRPSRARAKVEQSPTVVLNDRIKLPIGSGSDLAAYQGDVWERSIQFFDTLRQRADDLLAHERAGKPPRLDFDYELILDARGFEKPANHALLRITRIADDCLDDCLDPSESPVVVIDPRAGHGPDIGGFKQDLEVGIALRNGHPVYFVVFYPEPCPGQTLANVLHALRRFVKEVGKPHSGSPPILYGNCHAGWAITLLAADCEGLAGPIVLNGSRPGIWPKRSSSHRGKGQGRYRAAASVVDQPSLPRRTVSGMAGVLSSTSLTRRGNGHP